MDSYQRIAENFQNTIETIAMSVDSLAEAIESGSQLMVNALLHDRKILVCGNGIDAALAQLFTCYLINRFEEERPALPAFTLGGDNAGITAIARDIGINDIFSRQLRALGQPGDVLFCIHSSLGGRNLELAVQTAQERNMGIILLSNSLHIELSALLRPEDIELRVEASRQARVVELHTMTIHNLCELIDHNLFGSYTQE